MRTDRNPQRQIRSLLSLSPQKKMAIGITHKCLCFFFLFLNILSHVQMSNFHAFSSVSLKFTVHRKHICIRRQSSVIHYSFSQDRRLSFFLIVLFSWDSQQKVQAPAMQFTTGGPTMRPFTPAPRSLLSRTRRLEIFWLTKPAGAFFPLPLWPLSARLLSAHSFLSVETFASAFETRSSFSSSALTSPNRSLPLSRFFLRPRRPPEEFQLWSCVSGACLLRAAFCHQSPRTS